MFAYEHTTPIYFTSDVAQAAGMDPAELQGWMGSKSRTAIIVMGTYDREAAGSGRPRLFTLMRAYQVAIAKALVRRGLDPARAAAAALIFSDTGQGGSGWVGEPENSELARLPGQLFPEDIGDTCLFIGEAPDSDPRNARPWVRVLPVSNDADYFELKGSRYWGRADGDLGVMLRLNGLIAKVRLSLGLGAMQAEPGPTDGEMLNKLFAAKKVDA